MTKEAVKQDIAHEKAKSVERELFAKESNSSIKVEANDAKVVHGGESVAAEPVLKEDTGSAQLMFLHQNQILMFLLLLLLLNQRNLLIMINTFNHQLIQISILVMWLI